jgi:hypothetical protein
MYCPCRRSRLVDVIVADDLLFCENSQVVWSNIRFGPIGSTVKV